MGRSPARSITIAVSAMVVIGVVWLLRAQLAAGQFAPWSTALDAGAAVVASMLCARAARRAGNRRARVAWTCQGIACALWTLAPLTWLFSRDVPWRSAADVGRLGFLLFVAVGTWLTLRDSDWRARLRLLLDGTVGAAATLIVVWAFVIGPALPVPHPGAAVLASSLCYPLGVLVLMIFAGFMALTEFRPGRRRMPLLFVLGLIGVCVADLRFAELSLAAGQPVRTLDSAGWLLGFAGVAAAAFVYRGTTRRQTLPTSTCWLVFAPYLALLPAAATMGWQALTHDTVPTTELAAGAVIISVVLARQLLMLIENRSLVARLTASEQLLRHQASHDWLTGLGNRSLLVSRLEETLPEPLSLLFCDLDDFKRINDTLGHHAGDNLLTQVGDRLRAALRSEDTVVRLGGDEFAAVLAGPSADAQVIAGRVWESFQEPYAIAGHRVTVSASIGLTNVTAGTPVDADTLLRQADDAMYEAKRSGKNGVRVFEAGPPAAMIGGNGLDLDLGAGSSVAV